MMKNLQYGVKQFGIFHACHQILCDVTTHYRYPNFTTLFNSHLP